MTLASEHRERILAGLNTVADVLRLSAPASRLVGSAASLEVARNVAQCMISDPTSDIVEVCKEAVMPRVAHPETYGDSWRGVDGCHVAAALVKGWRGL
jgi:hypothetical protein